MGMAAGAGRRWDTRSAPSTSASRATPALKGQPLREGARGVGWQRRDSDVASWMHNKRKRAENLRDGTTNHPQPRGRQDLVGSFSGLHINPPGWNAASF